MMKMHTSQIITTATTGGLKVTKLLQVQESKDVNVSNHQDSVKIFHMGH